MHWRWRRTCATTLRPAPAFAEERLGSCSTGFGVPAGRDFVENQLFQAIKKAVSGGLVRVPDVPPPLARCGRACSTPSPSLRFDVIRSFNTLDGAIAEANRLPCGGAVDARWRSSMRSFDDAVIAPWSSVSRRTLSFSGVERGFDSSCRRVASRNGAIHSVERIAGQAGGTGRWRLAAQVAASARKRRSGAKNLAHLLCKVVTAVGLGQ